MHRSRITIAAAAALVSLGIPTAALGAAGDLGETVEDVSVAMGGNAGNGVSAAPAVTPDGRFVAFMSDASNLVAGDTNATTDVFVKDRASGAVVRASVATDGSQANGASSLPSISDDGTRVAFRSLASNLAPGVVSAYGDIFVRDLTTGTTTLASASAQGVGGRWGSNAPAISGDGSAVAFASDADDLVPGDTNGHADIFVKILSTGAIRLASAPVTGSSNGDSSDPSIGRDGSIVAFSSTASNLVPGDSNGATDVFLAAPGPGGITLVSERAQGGAASGRSTHPRISSFGNRVAYLSTAPDIVPGDSNGRQDVFVRSFPNGSTVSPSLASTADASGPALSPDGDWVAWTSATNALAAGDTNGVMDVFLADTVGGAPSWVSERPGGGSGNWGSFAPALSDQASLVAFQTYANNLFPNDGNGRADVVARAVERGGPPPPPSAPDLSLALSAGPDPATVGETIAVHAVVTNHGGPADSAELAVPVPAGTSFAGASGNCSATARTVRCAWTAIGSSSERTADLLLRGDGPGTVTIAATVAASPADADGSDNQAQAQLQVVEGSAASAIDPLATPGWQADGRVDDLAYVGDTLYVVGQFTHLMPAGGGATVVRNHAAAIQVSTGSLLPWDPNVDGPVRSIAAVAGVATVYLGGSFRTVGGGAHRNLVAVEAATTGSAPARGAVSSLAFDTASDVKSLALLSDGSRLFAGGIFHSVAGQTRHMLASWATATATLDPGWQPPVVQAEPWGVGGPGLQGPPCPPRCYPAVYSIRLAPDERSLYVGGTFAFVNGIPRNSAAQVAVDDGRTLAWDPNVYYSNAAKGSQNSVYDMALFGSSVFLCGDFFRVGGDDASHVATNVAAVDGSTGARLPGWSAHTDGAVNACRSTDRQVVIGGHFQYVGPQPQGAGGTFRNHVAAIDPTTGAVDAGWGPFVNSNPGIYAVGWRPGQLAIGGDFTQVQYRAQARLAQFGFHPA